MAFEKEKNKLPHVLKETYIHKMLGLLVTLLAVLTKKSLNIHLQYSQKYCTHHGEKDHTHIEKVMSYVVIMVQHSITRAVIKL